MNIEEIIERRLSNQNLSANNFSTPEEIVRWFGAVQSQDFAGATWALSQRLNLLSNTEIQKSFNEGKILRTHVLRPTWHFVSSQDLIWMLKLTSGRVKRMMGTYNKALGLHDEIFIQCTNIIAKELKNGNYLTRSEIGELLTKNNIRWNGNGLAHIVMIAELDGVICSGPIKDVKQTYALTSERIISTLNLSRDESLRELANRYFRSHGPAQLIDFIWWSGLLTSDAKKGIELNKNIKYEIVEGKTYYYFDSKVYKQTSKIYLLPNYDEYTVALRDRDALTRNVDNSKLDFRQNSLFNNVILIDGKIEGVWRRTIKSKTVEIETKLFKRLNDQEEKELHESLNEYANFIGLKLVTYQL